MRSTTVVTVALALCVVGASASYPLQMKVGEPQTPSTERPFSKPGQALFDYVSKPDSHYKYFDTGARLNKSKGWTGYLLNMTSQQWLTSNETTRSVWTHQLLVIVPDEIKDRTTAAIWVTGGDNRNPGVPKETDEDVIVSAVLAMDSGTITATLWQIPNQPMVFAADPLQKSRSEDAIVAFTWYHYAYHQDQPEWVVYLPMVKAVVRAMDTIEDYSVKHGAQVKKFLIAGASKRGATTWLTGAFDGGTDKRVIGIIPIVFDMLNFYNNVPHMFQAYGGWTFAFVDYWEMNITQLIGTQRMRALADIVDPLVYKDTLTMPKLVTDATGDEFFLPDDDYFWWGQLKGETYRLMVQNAEHSMATGVLELLVGASAFYHSLMEDTPRPVFNWTLDERDGNLTMVVDTAKMKPTKVVLRYAETIHSTPNRRDFRLIKGDTPADPCKFIVVHVFGKACLNPIIWLGDTVTPSYTKDGMDVYTHHAEPLSNGNYVGFFYELFYDGPGEKEFRMTTQVSIVPRTYPFPPCGSGPSCIGQLV